MADFLLEIGHFRFGDCRTYFENQIFNNSG